VEPRSGGVLVTDEVVVTVTPCDGSDVYVVAEVNNVVVSLTPVVKFGKPVALTLKLPKTRGQLTLRLYSDGVEKDAKSYLYSYTYVPSLGELVSLLVFFNALAQLASS
jgi:hypothetical protein